MHVCPAPVGVLVHVCCALVEAMERAIVSTRPKVFGGCMIEVRGV